MAEWKSYAFQLNVKIVVNTELYIFSLLARMVEFYSEWQFVVGDVFFFSLYLLNFFLNINTNPKRVHKMTTSEVFSFFSVAQVLHVTVTDLYTVYLTKLHKENAALNGGGVAHHLSHPHKKLTLTPYILSGEKHWAFGGLIDIQKALLCISSTQCNFINTVCMLLFEWNVAKQEF